MQPCSFVLLLLCVVAALSHIHSEDHDHEGDEPPSYKYSAEANAKHDRVPKKPPRRSESATCIWAEVSLAVLLISLAPLFVLCLLPNLQKHRSILKLLLAFAAGGLLSDAFLHLVPHAIEATQTSAATSAGHHHHEEEEEDGRTVAGGRHHHNHREYSNVGLSILFGVFTFLCVEKLIRLARGSSSGSHQHHQTVAVRAERPTKSLSENPVISPGSGDTGSRKETSKKKKKQPKSVELPSTVRDGGKVKDPVTSNAGGGRAQELKVASYLNLTADFMHNFTDGLAIGASFLMSRSLGIVTTFTVLMHELPHEIGDYAILVKSGCSSRKAILLQLTTAVGAALGAALSLLAAGVGLESLSISKGSGLLAQISSWLTEGLATAYLLAFTAGGFIYIAMTSVLPDLLEDEEEEEEEVAGSGSKEVVAGRRHSTPGFWRRLLQTLGELLAITAGVGMMVSLGLMEEAQGHV